MEYALRYNNLIRMEAIRIKEKMTVFEIPNPECVTMVKVDFSVFPTLVTFRNGQTFERIGPEDQEVACRDRHEIKRLLEEALGKVLTPRVRRPSGGRETAMIDRVIHFDVVP